MILPKVEFNASSAETTGPIPGRQVQGGDGGNAGLVTPVPSIFNVNPLSENLRFGFSVAGMLGGGYDYGDNFVGRYSIMNVELAGVGFTPSLGYRVTDKLSLGAGVTVIYTMLNQEIAIRQP